jgi:hypothetical protein
VNLQIPFLSGKRTAADPVLGEDRQLLVDELHGRNFNAALRGQLFVASTASAGIALIVPATTGNHPTLWNPLGSGVDLNIVRLDVSYVSGNNAPTAIEWAVTKNAGAQNATGSPILTFTKVAVDSARIGGPVSSQALWAPAVNTYTAAPAFYAPTGLSLFTGVAATAVAPFTMSVTYDGALVVAPGVALSLCSQAATTTALFQVAITFEEVPIKS